MFLREFLTWIPSHVTLGIYYKEFHMLSQDAFKKKLIQIYQKKLWTKLLENISKGIVDMESEYSSGDKLWKICKKNSGGPR